MITQCLVCKTKDFLEFTFKSHHSDEVPTDPSHNPSDCDALFLCVNGHVFCDGDNDKNVWKMEDAVV